MIKQLRPNIYPRTKENIRAIFLHYFPSAKISDIDEVTEKYYDENVYDLSKLEFFAENIAENIVFFNNEFKLTQSISLMMFYAIEALDKTEEDWTNGSKEMNRIKSEFRDLIISKMLE